VITVQRLYAHSITLRHLDELTDGGDAVDNNVDNVWASRGNSLVRRHGGGDALSGGTSLEASGVEESHAVTHVDGVGNETTVVKRNLDVLSVRRRGELDVELGAVGLEVLAGELDLGRTSGVSLEVRGSVDFVAELGDEGVLGGGLEDRLLNRVGTRDEKSTVKKEKGDTVVQARDGGLGTGCETLALGLFRVVEENLESRVLSDTESLSTFLTTVDPDDSSVREKSTFNHTTAFRHGVHLPLGVGRERLDATA
jgi:hypothetical protein